MPNAYDLLVQHERLRQLHISSQPTPSAIAADLQRVVEFGIEHAEQPAWWADDITAVLEAATPSVPDDWQLHTESLPTPYGFWWFPRGARVFDDPTMPPVQFLTWTLGLNSSLNGQPCYTFGLFGSENEKTYIDCLCWNVDTAVVDPEDNQNPVPEKQVPETRLPFRFIAAAVSFLAQRLAAPERMNLGRPERRWLAQRERPEPELSVIHFRKREHAAPRGAADVDWTCRWIVSGHWHRYHTRRGVAAKFLLPYVKGPDGKPVRLRGKVGAVVR